MIGGRVFGETIPGRYGTADLIDNPIMLLEYIKRQQNWQDNNGVPLIKTGSDIGSFDHLSLDEIKNLKIARQITDENLVWTKNICKSLCETFYLVSYQDKDGYECIDYFLREEAPGETITVSDIIPGSLGMIEEPKPDIIFVMPYLNYSYDYAFSKYTKSLQVLHVDDEESWSTEFTPGFQNNDGELIWNKCRALYFTYRKIEKIPQNVSDQEWIVDYDTALWKINKIIDYQSLKDFSFSVYYTKGRLWYPGQQIYIQFPNETDGLIIRSVITSVQKSKNRNNVSIKLKMLDQIDPTVYYTIYQQCDGSVLEWQPTDGSDTEFQEN